MNEESTMFVNDGRRWLNVSRIESVDDIPGHVVGNPKRTVTMFSGKKHDSPGTADELMDKILSGFVKAGEVELPDLDDVRFPAPGRPVTD